MTKLPLNLIEIKTDESVDFAPLIWDNGVALSNVSIFSYLKERRKNKVLASSIDNKILSLAMTVAHSQNKLDKLTVDSENLETKIQYLTVRVSDLQGTYAKYLETLNSLTSKLPRIDDLKREITETQLYELESNYNSTSDVMSYLLTRHIEATEKEELLDSRQAIIANNSLKVIRTIKSLITKTSDYESMMTDLNTKLNSISKLSISIEKNINACQYIYPTINRAFEELKKKQDLNSLYAEEYAAHLDRIQKYYDKYMLLILTLENSLGRFERRYEEAQCFYNQKEEELNGIVRTCNTSAAILDDYYALFIGSNFLKRGENVQLNRVGCAVIINAYLPELEPCRKPPVLPPMAADIKFMQDALPSCPPPVCTTTPAPTPFPRPTTTTTTPAPPPACSAQAKSGGPGVTTNTYDFSPWAGSVSVNYQMYSAPDKITVYLNDVVQGTTSVPVSGSGTITFNYPGSGVVKVVVEGPTGTIWDYNIKCNT